MPWVSVWVVSNVVFEQGLPLQDSRLDVCQHCFRYRFGVRDRPSRVSGPSLYCAPCEGYNLVPLDLLALKAPRS
jgi:hypothetical protein